MSRCLVMVVLWLVSAVSFAETVRLHGSNTIGATLMPSLVEAWLPTQGYRIVERQTRQAEELVLIAMDDVGRELTIEIASHGSSTGFRALAEGRADIGMSSRRIQANEAVALDNRDDEVLSGSEIVLALDAVAIIVHPSNPIASLSLTQVRDLFSGRIEQWRDFHGHDLDGLDLAVQLHARDDRSGTYEVFRQRVLGDRALSAKAQRYESNQALAAAVAKDPAAVGFVSLAATEGVRAVPLREGDVTIEPTAFQVATEDFPLARRLYLYAPAAARTPRIQSLIGFSQAAQGQEIAARTGYVSQNVFAAKVVAPTQAPEEYIGLTTGARRLSLNFRFDEREFRLDAKAQHDLDRVAEFLRALKPKPREVMLMGFADVFEAVPIASLGLAADRADYIAEQLLRRGVVATRVRGYGDAAAVADNTHRDSRLRNRRVEVWIR